MDTRTETTGLSPALDQVWHESVAGVPDPDPFGTRSSAAPWRTR